jgi:hypothetical protein
MIAVNCIANIHGKLEQDMGDKFRSVHIKFVFLVTLAVKLYKLCGDLKRNKDIAAFCVSRLA